MPTESAMSLEPLETDEMEDDVGLLANCVKNEDIARIKQIVTEEEVLGLRTKDRIQLMRLLLDVKVNAAEYVDIVKCCLSESEYNECSRNFKEYKWELERLEVALTSSKLNAPEEVESNETPTPYILYRE